MVIHDLLRLSFYSSLPPSGFYLFFIEMPSKRRKQHLNRGSKPNQTTLENAPIRSTNNLLEGADEYFAAGMRYPPEILIHKALYDFEFHIYFRVTLTSDGLINNRQSQGEVIPYLTEAERVDVNLLLVDYERANVIRRYEGLPILVPLGEMPIFEWDGMPGM